MDTSHHASTKLPDGINGTCEPKSPQDPESLGASNCANGPDSPEVPELQELRTREVVDDEEEEEEVVSRERSPVSKGPKHKAKKEVSERDGKEHKNHVSRASSPNYTGMTFFSLASG